MQRLPSLVGILTLLILAACAAPAPREYVDASDPAVMARIKQELRTHPEINVQYLDLNVDAGTVTVSGIVDSPQTREQIRRLVGKVAGVQQVIVNVLIRE